MPISHIHVDDRLVHAQLVEGWLKPLGIEHLVVVSEESAADPVRKTSLLLAAPPGVDIQVLSLEKAALWFKENPSDSKRTLVLAAVPSDVVKLIGLGVSIRSVTVAGLHHRTGAEVIPAVVLAEDDLKALKQLLQGGLRVLAQSLPVEASRDLAGFIS
jgi:PTS system mannose-specific IIB component